MTSTPRLGGFLTAWQRLVPPDDSFWQLDAADAPRLQALYDATACRIEAPAATLEASLARLLPRAARRRNLARDVEGLEQQEDSRLAQLLSRVPRWDVLAASHADALEVQRFQRDMDGAGRATRNAAEALLRRTNVAPASFRRQGRRSARLLVGAEVGGMWAPPPPREMVVSVTVFHSLATAARGTVSVTPFQTVEILGSQHLGDLRRAVSCVDDHEARPETAADYFFYIGRRLYCGGAGVRQAVRPLAEWLFDRTEIPNGAETADDLILDAATTRLADVEADLALRYLFCHQGSCEHSLTIEDLRIHEPARDGPVADYPKLVYASPGEYRIRYCTICEKNAASVACVGDRLADESPAFFCEPCHHSFHYDENGVALYTDYEIYPCAHA